MQYIAFVWNHESEAQCHSASFLMSRLTEQTGQRGWLQVLRVDGLAVFYAGRRSRAKNYQCLHGEAGVVFGALSKRHSSLTNDAPSPPAVLGTEESRKIIATAGKALVTDYWGNYAAFLNDRASGRTWVVHGPLSPVTLKTTRYEDVAIYASATEDIAKLGVLFFSFNFRQIAVSLVRDGGFELTALNEITEVPPGQCIEWRRGVSERRVYWHPLNFTSKADEITSKHEAIPALRSVVRSCAQTKASWYDYFLVSLSGGVDSSIVLASLEDVAALVKCFTHYSDARIEDERPLARAAARKAGRELFEIKRTLNFRYEDAFNLKLTPSPANYSSALLTMSADVIPPSLHSAEAVFFGTGGDEIFYRNNQRYCITDRLYRHQFSGSLVRDVFHAAIKDGRTIWNVLGEAAYDAFVPHRLHFGIEAFEYKRLMPKKLLEDLRRNRVYESQWFRSTRDAPPGKLYHAITMLQRMGGEPLFDFVWKPDAVSPLQSQPLIELALRISTDLFWLDGKERGLALKAFENKLTTETLQRNWKGGITSYHTGIVRKNKGFIEDVLDSSPLYKEGIYEREEVQRSLSDALNGGAASAAEIISAADTAIFFHLWNNSGYLRRSSSFRGLDYRPNLVMNESQ